MTDGSCGILPWRRAGFWRLAAGEGFDDAHRASAFGACLARVPLVGIEAPLLAGRLIRPWLRIDQTPIFSILSRRIPLARKPVWRMRWKPEGRT